MDVRKRLHEAKTVLLIGLITALSSEMYMHFFINDFRISPSVIVYPILMMTVGISSSMVLCALATAACIFLMRFLFLTGGGAAAGTAALTVFPGTFFYLTYSVIFWAILKDRYAASVEKVAAAAFFGDFLSNVIELSMREMIWHQVLPGGQDISRLALIAICRSVFVFLGYYYARWYRSLLAREEHERRYQRLFMLTTRLKSEIYLMHKNSEQIERVMGNAYRLYEEMQQLDIPEKTEQRGLEIARQVHEIKKDYLRIIQGIEEELGKDTEDESMKFDDLIQILMETARTTIAGKGLSITIAAETEDHFQVRAHYRLMSILNNLVNNAIEAIESDKKRGEILVREYRKDGCFCFEVHDNGPGISERHLKRIFQMGYSTKFDAKTGNIYRGVGLCGVKNLLEEQFGGSITVESEVGKYTVFYVTIPEEKLVMEEGKQVLRDGNETAAG